MDAIAIKARTYVDQALDYLGRGELPPQEIDLTYELVDSAGRVLLASQDLEPFDGPITPPPPTTGDERLVEQDVTMRIDDPVVDPARYSLSGRYLSGRTMHAVTLTAVGAPLGPLGLGNVRLTVFITPFEAEAAVARVDRVLRVAVPLAVLLIAGVAWLATNRALRPVERMRAQAAEISAQALHRRVPVPDSGDAIARLATTLNVTLDRLEHAATQQRRFIADAAHELRSPIASVQTQLEVALDQADRADWPRVAQDTVTDVQRLHSLAEDLLLLARFDAHHPAPSTPLDLAELVRTHVAARDDPHPISCRATGHAPMRGTPDHLERLLRNLLDNAMRHADTSVIVGVTSRDHQVVLDVCVDGPGIPAAERNRVFERFTRLDEARTRDDGGVGLGLAIARDIASRHGGRLTIGHSVTGARLIATFPTQ